VAELKKNHFIPKSVLKYWVDPKTPHRGVHVYDIVKKRIYVSTGTGSTPFSFAIGRDLYVHAATGTRAVGLEKWFSGLESSLGSLSRQAHDHVEEIKLGVLRTGPRPSWRCSASNVDHRMSSEKWKEFCRTTQPSAKSSVRMRLVRFSNRCSKTSSTKSVSVWRP
jgi:hypothetical protein